MFTLEQIVTLILAAIASCAGVALFFKGAALKVKIANMLLTVSNSLSQYGFTHLAVIAQRLAVGDFAGAIKEAEWLVRQLANPKTASTLFNGVFSQELTTRLSDSAQCTALMNTLSGWAAANPTLAKAAGVTITAITPA